MHNVIEQCHNNTWIVQIYIASSLKMISMFCDAVATLQHQEEQLTGISAMREQGRKNFPICVVLFTHTNMYYLIS